MGEEMSSDYPPGKCVRRNEQEPVDRISELPDEILVSILSFCTLIDAARTSILSKRWIGLWMYVSGLNFDAAEMSPGMYESSQYPENVLNLRKYVPQKYVEWVNKVLLSHKGIHLDVFRIRFDLDNSSKDHIDQWLRYALTRKVHKLDLNLSTYRYHDNPSRNHYDFLPELLGLSDVNSSAVSPFVSCGSGINTNAIFSFKSLRALTFNSVAVSGSVIEFFLHNCPFLEHLVVVNSQSLEKLKVSGLSLVLKQLEISCLGLCSLTVCDTNIVSLKVSFGEGLVLKNVPKLVDVDIGDRRWHGRVVRSAISRISCCLSTLEVLTLQLYGNQARMEGKEVAVPQLTKLKQLILVMRTPHDVSLLPFTYLIRLSPYLEKLALKNDSRRGGANVRGFHKIVPVSFPLQHLKVVEIHGYHGHEITEVGLIKYLVTNAVALETIIIDVRSRPICSPYEPIGVNDRKFKEEEARYRAIAEIQLQPVVPAHVEVVIL